MPRGTYVNPRAFPRVDYPEETRTFTDPRLPGTELTLTLRALGLPGKLAAASMARELVADFLGDGTNPPRTPLPAPDNRPVVVTEELLREIAWFYHMEVVGEGEQKVSPEDWIWWAHCAPDLVTEVSEAAAELGESAEAYAKNSAAAPSDESCAAPRATEASTPS